MKLVLFTISISVLAAELFNDETGLEEEFSSHYNHYQSPRLVGRFDPKLAGGVSGFIKVMYLRHSPLAARILVKMDLEKLNMGAIKAKYPKCNYEKVKFAWHLHVKWPNSASSSGFMKDCSGANTGGHYDPNFACGPASQYKKSDICIKKNKHQKYSCSYKTYGGYACEVGDFSGKFGPLVPYNNYIHYSINDFYFAPLQLFNKPMFNEPKVNWNIILHLACPEHKNPRILCTLLKRS